MPTPTRTSVYEAAARAKADMARRRVEAQGQTQAVRAQAILTAAPPILTTLPVERQPTRPMLPERVPVRDQNGQQRLVPVTPAVEREARAEAALMPDAHEQTPAQAAATAPTAAQRAAGAVVGHIGPDAAAAAQASQTEAGVGGLFANPWLLGGLAVAAFLVMRRR